MENTWYFLRSMAVSTIATIPSPHTTPNSDHAHAGETVRTPFDGLIAFTDATQLWGLHESTLRKAISYGKLINGVDACKYGKQWVISAEAMRREYGQPGESR